MIYDQLLPLKFCDSEIVIMNFVIVKCVSIKRVVCNPQFWRALNKY